MGCKSCKCSTTEEVKEAPSCNIERKPSTANEKIKVTLYLSQAAVDKFQMIVESLEDSEVSQEDIMADVLEDLDY